MAEQFSLTTDTINQMAELVRTANTVAQMHEILEKVPDEFTRKAVAIQAIDTGGDATKIRTALEQTNKASAARRPKLRPEHVDTERPTRVPPQRRPGRPVDANAVNKETDARFWAQTGYKPGQPLNPSNPADAKWIAVWVDVNKKLKREAAADAMKTTYDDPVVVQAISDANVADKAAAVHLQAAANATDPEIKQQNATAAATAAQIAAQKAHEAAARQPPTVSQQLMKEASEAAKATTPHPSAPASEHVAHVQAQTAHRGSPRGILIKETDARFWAQTGYKPNQRLDPKASDDAKMIPLWRDIFDKVKREDAAGKLVLTYNNPVVVQSLQDANVADQVAAQHREAAAASPDPWDVQQNTAAADVASQVSAQKTDEAAKAQPPTVSPDLAQKAAKMSDEDAIINRETYRRFWQQTRYKPGKLLDSKDPQDARMIPVWIRTRAAVQRQYLEHVHGHGHPPAGRQQVAQEQAKQVAHKAAKHHARGPHHRPRSTVHPGRVRDMRTGAVQFAHQVAQQSRSPFVLVLQRPDGRPEQHTFRSRAELDAEYTKLSEQHDQYRYIAAFDLTANPRAPVHDSVGVPAAEHADVPGAPGAGAPGGADAEGSPAPGGEPSGVPSGAPPTEEKKSSTGKIIAIVAAVAAAGGLAFAVSRKSSGRSSSSSRSRRRMPDVLVATPTIATPTIATPAAPTRAMRR